jgi:hypothetical protein
VLLRQFIVLSWLSSASFLNRCKGLHSAVVAWRIFDLAKHHAQSRNHLFYQLGSDRLFFCRFDTQKGVPEVFVRVRNMFAGAVGHAVTLGHVDATTPVSH